VIDAIEAGQAESEWVAEQLDRPIAKAWNAINSASFAGRGMPAGSSGRIAIPFSASGEKERDIALALVNETGWTPCTLARWRNPGGNSQVRRVTAPT
jgi:hypothetical protein